MPDTQARIALLIDADNSPASKIDVILAELAKYGVANIRRAYGNWKKGELKGWEAVLHEYAIRPMQQFDYTKGKSATDAAMIIDAMDLLYTHKIDAFAIISSDSDFTPLVMRIRAEGLEVYGFGGQKTPSPFVNACSKFLYLDKLRAPEEPEAESESSEPRRPEGGRMPTSLLKQDAKLVTLLRTAVENSAGEDGWAQLGAVGQQIGNQASFDPRNYGYRKLSDLIEACGLFDTERRGNSIYLRDKRFKRGGSAPAAQVSAERPGPGSQDRQNAPDRQDRPERQAAQGMPERAERQERPERSDRHNQQDRPDRHHRPDRHGQPPRDLIQPASAQTPATVPPMAESQGPSPGPGANGDGARTSRPNDETAQAPQPPQAQPPRTPQQPTAAPISPSAAPARDLLTPASAQTPATVPPAPASLGPEPTPAAAPPSPPAAQPAAPAQLPPISAYLGGPRPQRPPQRPKGSAPLPPAPPAPPMSPRPAAVSPPPAPAAPQAPVTAETPAPTASAAAASPATPKLSVPAEPATPASPLTAGGAEVSPAEAAAAAPGTEAPAARRRRPAVKKAAAKKDAPPSEG